MAYSFVIVLTYTWFIAFFNGDHVIVTINNWGEKWIELIMFCVLIPLFTYSAFLTFMELRGMKRSARYYLFRDRNPKKIRWL